MIEKSSTTLGTRLRQETSLNFISYINLLKIHPNFLHALYCTLLLLHLEDLIGCNEEGMSPNKINWLNFMPRHNFFLQTAEHSHVFVTDSGLWTRMTANIND